MSLGADDVGVLYDFFDETWFTIILMNIDE